MNLIVGGLCFSFGFQNCSSKKFAPSDTAENGTPFYSLTSPPQASGKLGLNFGVFSTQGAINAVQDLGTWYYNYSPHPNRADSNSTYESVTWANTYGKEFVPMIIGKRFKFGAGDASCPLIDLFAAPGETACRPDEMTAAMNQIKRLFSSTHQPRFLMTFNEPYLPAAGAQYKIPPADAAAAWVKIQTMATATGLRMISPTTSVQPDALAWMSEFLKSCYDHRSTGCDVENIYAFNVHEYQCSSDYWFNNYQSKGFQKSLIAKLGTYGGKNWAAFVNARKIWLSETNCNWDPDFIQAQQAGMYTRTQGETCLRATGQKAGFGMGSLYTLMSSSDSVVERIVWWNTYANPEKDSDGTVVSDASRNRIAAARLLDDNYNLTLAGRAYRQAYRDFTKLNTVTCADLPPTNVGLFMLSNGAIYHGFKDFYCHYPNLTSVINIWGNNWKQFTKTIPGLPMNMVNAGECGSLQGVHRSGWTMYYTYKKGYTCWINSTSKLSAFAGLSSSEALQLPDKNMPALGLDAQAITSRICP